ncbi:MAG: hypothetical protein WD739_06930 [Actinomycetota bacterium]
MTLRSVRFLVAAVTAALSLSLVPSASAATTFVVDDDGMAELGNCDAATATHATIQSAVDAAVASDIIHVCPGLYEESVTVPQDKPRLRLFGAQRGVDARTRDVGVENESIVDPPADGSGFSLLATLSVLDGFTVTGADGNAGVSTSPLRTRYRVQNNIVEDNVFGLYLHSSGLERNTQIKFNRFANNNLPGSASGNGIYSDQGAQDIKIRANSFSEHTNGAILFGYVEGVTNATILVQNNRSENDATFVNLFAASFVRILQNRTSDTRNFDDGVQGSSIRVGGESNDILIERNRLSKPAFSGIAIRDDVGFGAGVSNVQVFDNQVSGAEANGLDVTSAVAGVVQAFDNDFLNSDGDGISMSADTRGNLIRRNRAGGSAVLDCHDDSVGARTAGTANQWRNNRGDTDQPEGLCTPI